MAVILFLEDTEPSEVGEARKWYSRPAKADTEPAEEPKPVKPNESRREEIISLSYDQVNDNADELIELRGEGRYFGVTDPQSGDSIGRQQSLGPVCDNCHKRGHLRNKCKTVVCHKCGVIGDHYETQCPATVVCVRCGERGHIVAVCKNKPKKRLYCKTCDSFRHSHEDCPAIWRSYLTLPNNDGKLVLPVIYCYNCASTQHYGDECSEFRSSRIPNFNGSAFSGVNLPKYLRESYYLMLEGKLNLSGNPGSKRDSRNKDSNSFSKRDCNSAGKKDFKSYNKSNFNYKDSDDAYSSLSQKSIKHSKKESSDRVYKKLKKSSLSLKLVLVESLQPSRSGFLASKTHLKKHKLHDKHEIVPSRSGVISKKRSERDFN